MASNTLSRQRHALWLVRSRVLFSELAFWLVLLGYEPKKHRFSSLTYLAYALAFFAFWIFMVLLLLADQTASLLKVIPLGGPLNAAMILGTMALLAYLLYRLHTATRRSPLVFTEQDAYLLCLTPLDRRMVTLAWFFERWVLEGPLLWLVAVVLGYGVLQANFPRAMTAGDLPVFLLAGLRMFLVGVPLSLGALALAWAGGMPRLSGERSAAVLRWLALAVLALLAAAPIYGWLGLSGLLTPLSLPIHAGLGPTSLGLGLLIAWMIAIFGLVLLWSGSDRISLARASQETRDKQAMQAAAVTGRSDLADELRQRERLGAGHAASRLPARAGWPALLWKQVIQAQRRLGFGDLLAAAQIFALNLALIAFPEWGVRGWAVIVWLLLALQQCSAPLRRDLSRWPLLRSLPFRSETLVVSALALPVLGLWLAGVLALIVGIPLGWRVPLEFAWVYLVSVPGVALASAIDVLRQSKTGQLLSGDVPVTSLTGVLLGLLVLLVNGGAAWLFLVRYPMPLVSGLSVIMPIGLAVLYFLYHEAGNRLRSVA